MRLIIPFIRTVVWGEESPKTIVRIFLAQGEFSVDNTRTTNQIS